MTRLLAVALLALAASGCSPFDDEGVSFRLIVPDNNIRVEGVECAGARPFRDVHRGTRYRVEDETGKLLWEDELPAGRAVNADPTIDWGVERIPTYCVMEFEADLPERGRYRFRVARHDPFEFDASLLTGEKPVEITLSG